MSNNNLPDDIYKEAWRQLYMCFGERMQDEELELMDAALQGVKLDFEEQQDTLPNIQSSQRTLQKRQLKCLRCGYEWTPFVRKPKRCPSCKSPYWNQPKVKFKGVRKPRHYKR